MKLLYLCLFLLQISFSLSSLSTFNTIDTNIKKIKISKNFLTCLRNSTIPEKFLKQIESMNTIPMTILELLSHSFDRKEIMNIRYIINNCTDFLPCNNNMTIEESEDDDGAQSEDDVGAKENVFAFCSPAELTACLFPYIDLEEDQNDLKNLKEGSQDWDDKIKYVLDYYNKKEMYDCVAASFCEQFSNSV